MMLPTFGAMEMAVWRGESPGMELADIGRGGCTALCAAPKFSYLSKFSSSLASRDPLSMEVEQVGITITLATEDEAAMIIK
jgi:hypothetical protein